jgi:hypothetical protein
MKNIVQAVIAAALIFTATESFARGFSIGLFGAYSINGGPIENTINDKRFFDATNVSEAAKISYDEIIIPGAGLFASYTFRNGFSIRTGAEYYTLIAGGDISKSHYGYDTNKYEIEYSSYAVPLLPGITLSPDKGKTNIYAYAGMVLSMIDISQHNQYATSGTATHEAANKAIVPGFAALAGIERRLFSGFYIMLEFAFYKCENSKDELSHYYDDSTSGNYSYTERYGLPYQHVRIGARYSL